MKLLNTEQKLKCRYLVSKEYVKLLHYHSLRVLSKKSEYNPDALKQYNKQLRKSLNSSVGQFIIFDLVAIIYSFLTKI